jgi:hypothetical protein
MTCSEFIFSVQEEMIPAALNACARHLTNAAEPPMKYKQGKVSPDALC